MELLALEEVRLLFRIYSFWREDRPLRWDGTSFAKLKNTILPWISLGERKWAENKSIKNKNWSYIEAISLINLKRYRKQSTKAERITFRSLWKAFHWNLANYWRINWHCNAKKVNKHWMRKTDQNRSKPIHNQSSLIKLIFLIKWIELWWERRL